MGCFSFICKKSGEPVLSSSFNGDAVHLFLLKNGKVIEHMYGNYNSYGRVFSNKKEENDKSVIKVSPFHWQMEWLDVCDLIFHSNNSNGIAAILAPFWKEGDPYPTTRSLSDPDQGWGKHKKKIKYNNNSLNTFVENPFHKTFYENNLEK